MKDVAAFVDYSEFGLKNPVYLNLLRDPSALRSSGYYFQRDCICIGPEDAANNEWCQDQWHLKNEAFCNRDINACYEDVDACPVSAPSSRVLTEAACRCEPSSAGSRARCSRDVHPYYTCF